jgi:Ca2+-binding EF-hand superfamily protein
MGKKQARAKKKTGKAKPATTPEPVSPQSSTRPSEPSPSAPPESTNSNNRPPGPQGGPPLGVGPGLFRVLDLDADGKLAKAELAKAADTLMKFDKDADGLLAPDELAEGFRGSLPPDFRPPGFPPGDPARFMEMMQRADKNGDGKLTKDEMPERLRDRFDEIDRNKDGMLDKEELGPMGERLRRMREQGGATPGLPGRPGFGPGSRPGAAINDRNRERVAGLLRDYDKDIDGRISAKEFGESRADEFKGLDANGDGYLSPDELARRGQNR